MHDCKGHHDPLPLEIWEIIFILARNPELRLVSKRLWQLSCSSLVRAQYILHRYGRSAALGERAMSLPMAAKDRNVINHLLQMHCNPRADGDWLYWKACERDDKQLCAQILDAVMYSSSSSAATLGHLLNVAAIQGARAVIDWIVEKYPVDIIHEDDILMLACVENQVELVRHVMSRYGCDVHANRERHLRGACLDGHLELVDLLLPGAEVHAYHDAPLQNAAYKGHWRIVDRLLRAGATPSANNNAPLRYAFANEDLRTARLLLDAGADPQCQRHWPLRHVCRRDDVDGLMLLLEYGVDVNAHQGVALYEAVKSGSCRVLKILLDRDADPNAARALRGLAYATRHGKSDKAVRLMIKAGAKLDHVSACITTTTTITERSSKVNH